MTNEAFTRFKIDPLLAAQGRNTQDPNTTSRTRIICRRQQYLSEKIKVAGEYDALFERH